jgi:hypothetical protein
VSRAEIERYLNDFVSNLAHAVALRLDATRLDLIPLKAPQIDLLGNDGVGRAHHLLTLHYFVPTPDGLRTGSELVVENRLWPDVPALGMLQAEGLDGCRLEALPRGDPVCPPLKEGKAREFKARLVVLPDAAADPLSAPRSSQP